MRAQRPDTVTTLLTPTDAAGSAEAPARRAAGAAACPNCGSEATGRYCANCGQETTVELPSAGRFLREAAGRYVALDSRLWRSLGALLFRRGLGRLLDGLVDDGEMSGADAEHVGRLVCRDNALRAYRLDGTDVAG